MLEALEQALNIALQKNDGVSDWVTAKLDNLDQQLLGYMREDPYVTQENLVVLRDEK